MYRNIVKITKIPIFFYAYRTQQFERKNMILCTQTWHERNRIHTFDEKGSLTMHECNLARSTSFATVATLLSQGNLFDGRVIVNLKSVKMSELVRIEFTIPRAFTRLPERVRFNFPLLRGTN